jgi:TPR repeat protein
MVFKQAFCTVLALTGLSAVLEGVCGGGPLTAAVVEAQAMTAEPAQHTTESLLAQAEADNAEAQFVLGASQLANPADGKGVEKGLAWLRRAVAKGHSGARVMVAGALLSGTGTAVDRPQALKLAREAAEAGNADGQVLLATLYHQGIATARDDAGAAAWLTRAVALGKPEAMTGLGLLYLKGEGVPRDAGKAAELFRQGADAGNADAALNLGLLLLKGDGLPADKGQAARMLLKAARAGHHGAQYNLGLLYVEGQGVERDPVAAVKWLALAGTSPEPEMHKRADDTLKQLSAPFGATAMADGFEAARQFISVRGDRTGS